MYIAYKIIYILKTLLDSITEHVIIVNEKGP